MSGINLFAFSVACNVWRGNISWFISPDELHELQIPGLVNVDFADVRAIMANAGSSLMGIGTATGKFKKLGNLIRYQ